MMMLPIEYIWSVLAVTQAFIVTLQAGSKLLLVPPSSSSSSSSSQSASSSTSSTNTSSILEQQLYDTVGINNSSLYGSSDILSRTESPPLASSSNINTSCMEPHNSTRSSTVAQLRQQQEQQEKDSNNDQKDKEDIIRAFHYAVQIGLLFGEESNSSNVNVTKWYDRQLQIQIFQKNDLLIHIGDTTTSRNNNYNDATITIITKHCSNKPVMTNHVVPYRMSLTPYIIQTYPNHTETVTTVPRIEIIDHNDIHNTTTPFVGNDTNHSDTFSLSSSSSSSSSLYSDIYDYYETNIPLSQQESSSTHEQQWKGQLDEEITTSSNDTSTITTATTTTTTARIRVYAPQTFRTLRSYYYDNNSNNIKTIQHDPDTDNTLKIQISEQQFQQSILLPSFDDYTFLQTNSKGSQRTKSIFLYTNSQTPYTNRIRDITINWKQRLNSRITTRPQQYLIKSIKKDEFNTLLNTILPQYVPYMKQYGHVSLLNRIYGIYDVTIYSTTTTTKIGTTSSNDNAITTKQEQKRYYLIILNTIFDPKLTTINTMTHHNDNRVITNEESFKVYDIKGSTVGRTAKCDSESNNVEKQQQAQRSITYKDLDLIMECNIDTGSNTTTLSSSSVINNYTSLPTSKKDSIDGDGLFHIGSHAKSALIQQLRNDVQFLNSCSVIDYSLLVGIDNNENGKRKYNRNLFWGWKPKWNKNDISYTMDGRGVSPLSYHHGIRNGRPTTYYFGIIDFLQPYNYKKEIEYRLKGLMYEKNTYSCIPPNIYGERFLHFLDQYIV